jgi:hydroxymethylpyrimidine pyrophosphatase-like HAD family hydrolase
MNKSKLQMVITDLDGTLFSPEQTVSEQDYSTLKILGNKNICRVIATGRSYYSAKKILPTDFPIDYLIFSTGAGIMNWRTQEKIFKKNLTSTEVSQISNILIDHRMDFMILDPIPDSHFFYYYKTSNNNHDFTKRLDLYKSFARPLSSNRQAPIAVHRHTGEAIASFGKVLSIRIQNPAGTWFWDNPRVCQIENDSERELWIQWQYNRYCTVCRNHTT